LFTAFAPSNRDQADNVTAPDEYRDVQPAIDHAKCLRPLLPVGQAMRGQHDVVRIGEHPLPERQRQSMLEAVGFILGRIEREPMPRYV
jgi:hypothetical protein